MEKIPGILDKKWILRKMKAYMDTEFSEVRHTTLNPEGPGAIRIHLIPPAAKGEYFSPSVAIINGTDIIPVNFVWALMLCEMINQVNKYDGKEISEAEIEKIRSCTVEHVKKLIPLLPRKKISDDLETIYRTMHQISYRQEVTTDIQHMNIGEYADLMKAPHRMDIMVSAMTKNGCWHCNQKCIHCYAAGQEHADEAELSTDDWKQILDKLKKAGVPQVTFTGGEPTLREDLFELISHARWFISRLNTNGRKLTKEYCAGLRKAELDSVQITFYSSDREIHNRLTGSNGFDETCAGIENALEAGIPVSINTPLCTLNKDYVATLRYLKSKGVIFVTCSGLITTGNAALEASESLQLGHDEIRDILTDAVNFCKENGMEIAFTSPGWIDQDYFNELGISTPSCGACLSNMAVTPSGNVVPCQSWLSDDTLGNMLTDSWSEIWNRDMCVSCRNYSAQLSGKCPLRRYCL